MGSELLTSSRSPFLASLFSPLLSRHKRNYRLYPPPRLPLETRKEPLTSQRNTHRPPCCNSVLNRTGQELMLDQFSGNPALEDFLHDGRTITHIGADTGGHRPQPP